MNDSIKVEKLEGNNMPKVDVKLEQNSKGVNVTIHVYEGVQLADIQKTVDLAVQGLNYGNDKVNKE